MSIIPKELPQESSQPKPDVARTRRELQKTYWTELRPALTKLNRSLRPDPETANVPLDAPPDASRMD